LRIVLCAIGAARAVKSNDLMPQDIWSAPDAGWDSDDPGVIV
jgi:hypothetical protein